MLCKLQGVIAILSIIAVVQATTILVTDVVYITVSRSAIYNESGMYFTEYLLGNPLSASMETTTSQVSTSSSFTSIEEITTPASSVEQSTVITTKVALTSEVGNPNVEKVATSSTTPIVPPPAPTTVIVPKSSSTTKSKAQTTTIPTTAAAPVYSSPKTPTPDSSFASEILSAHNAKRAAHGVAPLAWSQELNNYAQKVANAYDCSGNLKHTNSPYGENLGVGYSSAQSVVNAWYIEGANYNYQTATKFDHFTQVIWKSTTQLGCAYKDCSSKGWGKYVICNYKQVGNVKGQGRQNVLPLV
ncbi:hypothetical protein CANMA_004250 [Candida margitis]|uniref:uncharacterized protein n=1 Tax=Candida margitis TaxID=1775924 RepID=UPI002226AA69|nr:uncharacterized protein CANMA_004250 [Candida margitis]KAI5958406.1 hypothetical protein CANMA_004250 [Candida margitis]